MTFSSFLHHSFVCHKTVRIYSLCFCHFFFFCCCTLKMPIRQFIAFKSYRCWNQKEVDLYFCSFSICPSQLILLTDQNSKFTAQPYCAHPENSINTWVWKIIQNIDITRWVRGYFTSLPLLSINTLWWNFLFYYGVESSNTRCCLVIVAFISVKF